MELLVVALVIALVLPIVAGAAQAILPVLIVALILLGAVRLFV